MSDEQKQKEMTDLEREYTAACIKLGNLAYSRTLIEEQLDKNEYESNKLIGQMESLNKKAAKLNEKTEVALPKGEMNEQLNSENNQA